MQNSNAYRDAKRSVERKIGLTIHATVFVAVNTGLFLLNLFFLPGRLWVVWPLFGWGIGLLFHACAVLLNGSHAGWKQRMIENELKKHAR
ncbi:2TM domain-containing protein [Noviherbaspirillum sp.]|uniref:2TM domain-containing protein n=1 Tax=Noviherbaspirillum sp. TaxID=1926288 RepID=UPI0025E51810|nr:2TM domain-containing protein [Noviherbaspirillum sp.]